MDLACLEGLFKYFNFAYPGYANLKYGPADLDSILTYPGYPKIESERNPFPHLVGLHNKDFRQFLVHFKLTYPGYVNLKSGPTDPDSIFEVPGSATLKSKTVLFCFFV